MPSDFQNLVTFFSEEKLRGDKKEPDQQEEFLLRLLRVISGFIKRALT